jgi:hypothetical protein
MPGEIGSQTQSARGLGALQDATALTDGSRTARSVLECGGPPPLFPRAKNQTSPQSAAGSYSSATETFSVLNR